ncbi:hypothetical protein RJ55_06246 [Drechmeria coniospora]|nr:hypothetical protein RJ55_06246 [Drechmeria coniospora]
MRPSILLGIVPLVLGAELKLKLDCSDTGNQNVKIEPDFLQNMFSFIAPLAPLQSEAWCKHENACNRELNTYSCPLDRPDPCMVPRGCSGGFISTTCRVPRKCHERIKLKARPEKPTSPAAK